MNCHSHHGNKTRYMLLFSAAVLNHGGDVPEDVLKRQLCWL